MALGLADLLSTFGWVAVAKRVDARSLGPRRGCCCCRVGSVRSQPHSHPAGQCWVAPFKSLLIPIPKKKGYEDTAENQNTLQAFWLGGQSSFGGRGMLWWGAEAQGSAEC